MWSAIARVIIKMMGRISIFYHRIFWYPAIRGRFHSIGLDVIIENGCRFSGENNISIGNHVYIGDSSRFLSTDACIYIGSYVMFGPEVTIITGDHRFDIVGKYMYNVKQKLEGNDIDVVIEDDVWIGARAIILKGVRVGKGSIIGAGSVVTKEVEPYSIIAGVPAIKIGMRFSEEDITRHEEILFATKTNDELL